MGRIKTQFGKIKEFLRDNSSEIDSFLKLAQLGALIGTTLAAVLIYWSYDRLQRRTTAELSNIQLNKSETFRGEGTSRLEVMEVESNKDGGSTYLVTLRVMVKNISDASVQIPSYTVKSYLGDFIPLDSAQPPLARANEPSEVHIVASNEPDKFIEEPINSPISWACLNEEVFYSETQQPPSTPSSCQTNSSVQDAWATGNLRSGESVEIYYSYIATAFPKQLIGFRVDLTVITKDDKQENWDYTEWDVLESLAIRPNSPEEQ